MILREPTISDLRLSLVSPQIQFANGQQRHAATTPNVAPAVAEGEIVSVRDGIKQTAKSPTHVGSAIEGYTAEHASVVDKEIEVARTEPTFEQVVTWLAVQDADTRKACANILDDEVTQIHERAKQEGWDAGRKVGEVAGAKEVRNAIDALTRLHEAAEDSFCAEQSQLQTICVEIVAEALTKIAGDVLTEESAVVGAVREVLTRVKEGREVTVRVARADLPYLQNNEDALTSALSGRKLELIADSRVELGGCIVETKLGSLDGRLEVQLRELYETLRLAKAATQETN